MPHPRHLLKFIEIDELLRSRQRHTTKTLATALEVGDRTVSNYIDCMRRDYDAPIVYSVDKGYYYSDEDWRLPTVSLSQDELLALVLGAKMLEKYSGSAYTSELKSGIKRLAERLPETTWLNLQQVADELIIFRGTIGTELSPEIWQGLAEACREQKSIQMTYFTAGRNVESERKLDPYLLEIYRGTNPYVIGYCHNHQDIRSFRIDRIRKLAVLPDRFERLPTFNPEEYLEQIFQVEAGSKPTEVTIWFDSATAPYISERCWNATQVITKQADGSLTLKMTVRGLNEVKRWVLGYGRGAKVLQPQALVKMVRDELNFTIEGYSKK
jgi:predicted DNA-binding transcriptional regulator YafY